MARAVHDTVPVVPTDAKPAKPRGKQGAGATPGARAGATPRVASRPAGSAGAIAARTDSAFAEAAALRARAEAAAAAAMGALRFTGEGTRGLTFERRWTHPGVHPYDEIAWEIRTAAIGNESGKLVFEQKDVEVPASWSQLATNVVVSKYFRGHLNTPERETSVRQLIDRVVLSIAAWAETQHYFATTEDLAAFTAELTYLLVHQKMSFNSPVWFNVGIEPKPQCSACQPWRALVSTPGGMVPIGRLVDEGAIGREVYDPNGVTRIVAVKHNGHKPVRRIVLANGNFVEATPDHVVRAVRARRTDPEWLRVDELEVGMRMHLHPHRARVAAPALVADPALIPASALVAAPVGAVAGVAVLTPDLRETDATTEREREVLRAEAALAGWLQADGFVGQYDHGTNRSLTIEFQVANDDEYRWVMGNLDVALPHVHVKVRDAATKTIRVQRIRVYGEVVRAFVERWELLARGTEIRVPSRLWTASYDEVSAYLRSVFQADGFVTVQRANGNESGRIGFAVIGERWTEDVQLLLNSIGVYSRRLRKADPRPDRRDMFEVHVGYGSERARFAELVGFVGRDKQARLLASLGLRGLKSVPNIREEEIVAIDDLGVEPVYDVQTESGEYLSNNVAVHNCFINSVQDSMTSIMDLAKTEAMLFKFGSGAGSNLSTIRSSREKMAGGGTASGPVSFMKGYDAFAGVVKCLVVDTYVSTGGGLLRIDEAIEADGPVGFVEDDTLTLNTPAGPTRISHVYRSPLADVRTATLRTGLELTGTHEHPVLTLSRGFELHWTRLADLRPGDRVAVERRRELWPARAPALDLFHSDLVVERRPLRYPTEMTPELARLLGYLVAEGSIEPERFRFSSADPAVMADYCRCVEAVFGIDPTPQVRARVHPTTGVETEVLQLSWKGALQFLAYCGLPAGRSAVKSVPLAIRRSPRSLVLEFLGAYAEGDAHLGASRIEIATASSRLAEEIQLLALNLGVVGRRSTINGYQRLAFLGAEAAHLARVLRPYLVTPRKREAAASLVAAPAGRNPNLDVIPGLVPALRSLLAGPNGWVRATNGEVVQTGFGVFNRSGDNVSYARTRAIPDLVGQATRLSPTLGGTIERVLDDEYLWDEVVTVADAGQALTYDFTVPGVHAFVANGIVSHNSGGKTRRAAKMVILDVDHPDILDFVDSKKLEEQKAWALIEQGYDASFTGEAYGSVAFQNANHSVRVTDDFMRAVEHGSDWTTHAVVGGAPMDTRPARHIFRRMAEAAHVCGDPGIQYDTTINEWNPVSNTDRQYATNPCSEYSFLNDSSCNLASLNLMTFVGEDGELDVEAFRYGCRLTITAQEILVDNASYPTPKIEENSHRFRPLGLGYANLGALLMSRGLAYDSLDGQAYAAAITSVMTAEAYRQSAVIARDHGGPFVEFAKNRAPFLAVIEKHRAAAAQIPTEDVPAGLAATARELWDETYALGEQHGYRNAQTTLLAPTGCLVGDSLVLTDRGLVRLRGLGNPDGEKWQDLDLRVATDDGPREATRFYVNGAEPVVTVETSRGYRIQGTTTHRIKVVDTNGDWQWRRFADVRAGDRVPMTLGGMVGEPREVPLPPLPEAYWTSDHRTFVPRYLNADLAELVGYFMGDGSLHARGLRFCVTAGDDDVVARITELGRRLFGLEAAVAQKTGYIEVALHSVRLTLWWEACGFTKHVPNGDHRGKGYEAHIPDAVLYTNDAASYRAFLRGLFEADGNVSNGYASFSTVSDRFSREVQTLLLALGFATTRKVDQPTFGHKGTNPIHVLRILNASSGGRFLEEISFVSERKRSALARKEYPQAARYDLIPVSRATVDRLAPENDNLRKTMLLSLSRTGLVSRRSATALLERAADPRLAQALGYFYDEIASATLGAEQLTYDLSVPANITYVANGFVSHNTIAFMMDCDTTGIEPDIALIKYKKLVGEGYLKIVNNTVPGALRQLGYTPTQVEEIVAFVDERETIEGAPGLKPDHLPVFDCAFKPRNGVRSIVPMGHVRMMAAVQPFLSGAISKTVNMPETATVDEIEQIYLEGWRLDLKAIAIYRDNSKRSQPLSTTRLKSDDENKAAGDVVAELRRQLAAAQAEAVKPHRRRLPAERAAVTHKFDIAGHEGYITVGLYPDGQPGEIFLKMAKEGSTVSGLMDTYATAISLALQYGVPLRDLVNKFAHVRFEPSGFTGNSEIPIAKSSVDYIFRWLGSRFLVGDDRAALGIQDRGGSVVASPFTFGAAALAPQPEEGPSAIDEAQEPPRATATAVATVSAEAAPPAASAKLDLPVVGPARNSHANGNGNGHAKSSASSALAASLGVERTAFKIQEDAPSCADCGSIMVRNGSCYKCLNCGSTSGCS